MSERWKPEEGSQYWIVDFCYQSNVKMLRWVNDRIDKNCYSNNNCFKTEAKARAAAKKVKALLLSLHDNGETLQDSIQDKALPKLTAEVFNRPDCPEWAKWAAVSKFGCLTFFEEKPVHGNNSFLPLNENNTTKLYRNESGRWDASDWQNSLIERPAKLPDWCKVGEWVYLTSLQTYKKIADEDERAYIKENGFAKNLRQGRLRPYNAEEMKALVGKVIEDKDGDRYLVYNYNATENTVETSSFIACAEALLRDCSVGGKNAGVLEHLNENGEWVE